MGEQRIIAVGPLTEHDLALLGSSFSRAYPIQDTPCFTQLLHEIDEADRKCRGVEEKPEMRIEPVRPAPVIGGGRG